jgi:membrane-bound acyltransferase YfiQ involved in biofilm formation
MSQAAYPVYVLHMVFLYLGSIIIFPLDIVAPLKFLLVLLFTFAGCYATYEIIRRIKILRFLFGLNNSPRSASSQTEIQKSTNTD